MQKSNRNKYSIFNALSAVLLTLVNGVLGIVVTKMIINTYGSDFNGLNSTANQIVNVLLIVEGGFTLASNVTLFYPLTKKDYTIVNSILALTKKKFESIGWLFLICGIVISIIYTFMINSRLSNELIFSVIIMTIVPAAFNLYYATTYRVLLQTQQKEYVINIITMSTIGLGHLGNILLIICNGPIWLVRAITMLFALINSILIGNYVKKKNKFINLNVSYENINISGTKDVMAQKITGVIYNSLPIVFISMSTTGGTVLASVYAVYNNIFNMIKSILRGIIDAPRLGIGQLLTEEKKENVWFIFAQYEYIVFISIFVTLCTAYILILPFISIYTEGISDATYYDFWIAFLMVLIAVFELIHIPSGHLINMAGKFKIAKNIQIISCVVLLILMMIGGINFGIYGLLWAVLIVSILLAFLEIWYVHAVFFENKINELIRLLVPFLISGFICCYLETNFFVEISGVIEFITTGFILTLINSSVAIFISLIFARKELSYLVKRGRMLLIKK